MCEEKVKMVLCEEDEEEDEQQQNLNWKEFFGSSVELAPTLLGIYDNYIAGSSKTVTFAEDETRIPITPTDQAQHPSRFTFEDAQQLNGYGDMDPPPPPSVTLTSSKIGQGQNDIKKRPLSISSTTSSNSSTSSLPRHQRKKVAMVLGAGSNVVDEYHSDLRRAVFRSESHTSDELDDSKTSSQSDCDSKSSSLDRDDQDLQFCPLAPRMVREGVARECPPEELTEGNSYIDKVVAEIIHTERTYVKDLRDIIQGYLWKVVQDAEDLQITKDDIKALFGNIEAICHFNREFLYLLEQCDWDPVAIAQCFVAKNEGFAIYCDYCTNYPRSVEMLTTFMRQDHIADVFKQQQLALHHSLPLGSFLLKPVQRVLKYHLLLKNILNNFDESWPGHSVILEALDSMTCMAQHINDMKRKHEHILRVQEIQSILYGWTGADLTTFGELVLEDVFRMHGAKGWRQIFLFEKNILLTKKKEDGTLLFKDAILCSNLMLIESIPGDPLSFHVIPFNNPRVQHTIQAKNMDQKRLWCQEAKRLLLENFSATIPDKAKELVMKLGKSREEEDFEDSQLDGSLDSAPKKSHQAPEYLERRKGRRKSTSIIPDFGLLKTRRSMRKASFSPKTSPRMRRKSDRVTLTSPASAPRLRTFDRSNTYSPESSCYDDTFEEEGSLSHAIEEEEESTTELRPTLARSESLSSCDGVFSSDNDAPADSRATSYDDSCSRAKRLSQVLDAEGLTLQLVPSASQHRLNWDKTMVASVLNVSSVKKAESIQHLAEVASKSSVPSAKNRTDKNGKAYQRHSNIPFIDDSCGDYVTLGGVTRGSTSTDPGEKKLSSDCAKGSNPEDPWVKQTEAKAEAKSDKKTVRKKSPSKLRRLFRSNSFSSMDDLTKSIEALDGKPNGHRRLPSDTIVFTNRRAFLASPGRVESHPAMNQQLARLATPPRELGPQELIASIEQSRQEGRTVMRLGTPPRALPPSSPAFTCKLERELLERLQNSRDMLDDDEDDCDVAFDGLPANDQMWSSVQDYLKMSSPGLPPASSACSTPSSPTHAAFMRRPGSFHGTLCHSTQQRNNNMQQSNDSLIDSLKSAMHSLTSKIRRHPRSIDSSPCRAPRARSADALNDFRIDRRIPDPRLEKYTKKEKKKKMKFVHNLARVYSDRLKRGSKPKVERRRTTSGEEEGAAEMNVTDLEQRMAACSPVVLGTYSLPRHRPPRPRRRENANNQMSDSFYEQRFAEDIDGLSEGLNTSDSDVHSQESEGNPHLKEAIKETVKLIENRFQSRVFNKIEVKSEEKAQSLDHIKQHLERKDLPNRSVGERTRELMECATLTRIRQSSCTVGEGRSEVAPLRKGWVKTVVDHMQSGVFLNNTDGVSFDANYLDIILEEDSESDFTAEAPFFFRLIEDPDFVLV